MDRWIGIVMAIYLPDKEKKGMSFDDSHTKGFPGGLLHFHCLENIQFCFSFSVKKTPKNKHSHYTVKNFIMCHCKRSCDV